MRGGLPGSLVAIITVAAFASGCEADDAPDRSPLRIDDAFVSRIVPHQRVALELIATGAKSARGSDVRRLARGMRAMRRRTLPALEDRLTRMPASSRVSDLGVSAQQAADELTPASLAASRPLDPAFLTIMTRHDQGALALVTAELERGRDPAIKAAAQRLAAELTRELGRLNRLLADLARRQ